MRNPRCTFGRWGLVLALLCPGAAPFAPGALADPIAAPLPAGVRAVWDPGKAYRESTATREQVCLNGLWRWQPGDAQSDRVPAGDWGWFKVPGSWPGTTDYMQKDSQRLYAHPSWQDRKPGGVIAAWYQREITIPNHWAGRRVAVRAEYLNSYGAVFVDGKRAGEIHFPGGELDLTALCQPGGRHSLSILVVAMPLKGVVLSYTDSASAREVKGSVARRGLCGDVSLISTPSGPRVVEVRAMTSVRRKEIIVELALDALVRGAAYALRARISQGGQLIREWTRPAVSAGDLKDGRVALVERWMPDKLWDIHTPQHTYELDVSLLDANGQALDATWPVRFGFRELWVDGRDFYLNGTRLYLSAVPLDNAQVSARLAGYPAARESLERLKSFGINFVYTHNYGCEPGSHLGFTEILRAADDVGMLVGFSQPHFGHYEWQAPDADDHNGYARHATFYVQAAQHHPSVVCYAMSHNATGYSEDMNPDMIDGLQDPRDSWASKNAKLALRAQAIVRRLDPSRLVYHHASGNLGSMHAINFYPNFVPIQELSDWFEHWATRGVKPVFLCEYGAPFSWDWAMYRGWYQGQREFGSAKVPWEFCLAEWNAQFLGDRAFQISDPEKANLRWEARQLRAGRVWQRWDYPHALGSTDFDERYPVFARYLTDNWRAFRTWGVSALSPWEHEHFWKLRRDVDKQPREWPVDWENLQRPGFSPDYETNRYERMDLAYERSDWIATPAALALLRNNRPLLAYLGGKPARFTSHDHNFLPGETVEKQLILINNSRETLTCDSDWTLALPQAITGARKVSVAPGQQERLPVRFDLPATLAPGSYPLSANFRFGQGEIQTDALSIEVLPLPTPPAAGSQRPPTQAPEQDRASKGQVPGNARIAVFDPQGETSALLKRLGIRIQPVDAGASLASYDILIAGKAALTPRGGAPDVGRVREGLKVILFEQSSEVLERRFGLRVVEYGLRQVFPRVPDHPLLAGLAAEHLRDWRGEATILPSQLKYELRPRHGPTVSWCDLPVTRLWRCGNRGNVASVLIEKPPRGDFLPIVDGGYSLQYSPLLEYREGSGLVLFCQLDVTGRSESDPAAARLVDNLLRYVIAWKPAPRRQAFYVGDPAGMKHLEAAGVVVSRYNGERPSSDHVLVVGPGGGRGPAQGADPRQGWVKAGGCLLALGLDQQELNTVVPVTTRKAEHIAAFFESPRADSLLAGVGPADVHNRDPREVALVSGGAQIVGNGVLAAFEGSNVVLCSLAPWQFSAGAPVPSNLRRTQRRVSFLVSRLLGNLGVPSQTPLLDRFHQPLSLFRSERRWLDGFYLDTPEEWDDPYRFFRW